MVSRIRSQEWGPMRRRDVLGLGSLALAAQGLALTKSHAASTYPERPIRLIVPFPPGGGFDTIGRPWADRIKPRLGTIFVENQGGGGSSLGAATVAHFQSRRLHASAWRIEHTCDRGDFKDAAAL